MSSGRQKYILSGCQASEGPSECALKISELDRTQKKMIRLRDNYFSSLRLAFLNDKW